MSQSVRGHSGNNSSSSSNSDGEVVEVVAGHMDVDEEEGGAGASLGGMSRTASGQAEPPDSMEDEEEQVEQVERKASGPDKALDVAIGAVTDWVKRARNDESPSGDELDLLLGGIAAIFPSLTDEERAEQPVIYGVGKWLSNRATLVGKAATDAKDAAEALTRGLAVEVERLGRVYDRAIARREAEAREAAKRRAAEEAEGQKATFLAGLVQARALDLVASYCERHGRDEEGNLVTPVAEGAKRAVRPRPAYKGVGGGATAPGGASTPATDAGGSSGETPKARRRFTRGERSATLTGKTITLVESAVSSEGEPEYIAPPSGRPVRVQVPPLVKREPEPGPDRASKRVKASGAAPSAAERVKEEGKRKEESRKGGRFEYEKVGALPEGQSRRLIEIVVPGCDRCLPRGELCTRLPPSELCQACRQAHRPCIVRESPAGSVLERESAQLSARVEELERRLAELSAGGVSEKAQGKRRA
ncbi:hypothetical protein ACEPAI_7296 [Sanghuangporus weigelae]